MTVMMIRYHDDHDDNESMMTLMMIMISPTNHFTIISILSFQRSNGKWVATKRFSQRQIEKEKIRYVHSRGNPRLDYVTFAAQVFPS